VILGGGCAGMSLAYRLFLAGYTGSVKVIERSADFDREQRWCSWGPLDPILKPFVSKSWSKFVVAGKTGRFHRPTSAKYFQIGASDFLSTIAGALQNVNNFELVTNAEVLELHQDGHDWSIVTSAGTITSSLVFDGRNILEKKHPEEQCWLWQSFAGSIVTTADDYFDPDTFTLMDFVVPDGDSGAFIYILPYSRRTALIESTLISVRIAEKEEHLERVQHYIQCTLPATVSLGAVEAGLIPMTTSSFPFRIASGLYNIGTLSGAVKPSTGYAFSRIQRQSKDIVRQILKFGRPLDAQMGIDDRRRKWLDDVFLTAALGNEKFFTSTVLKMFEHLPADLVIRFLSENDTITDDLRVMNTVRSQELTAAASAVAKR